MILKFFKKKGESPSQIGPRSLNSRGLVCTVATLFGGLLFGAGQVNAASFTTGNIVVEQIGNGTEALSANGNTVILNEYKPDGTFVQSITLPTTTTGSNRRLVASGASTTEGLLTRSFDGRYLLVPGYDAAPSGTVSVSGATSAVVNRVVGRVDSAGNIDTTTALTDAHSAGNIRSAASIDGMTLFTAGSTGGVRSTSLGATTSTQLVATPTNLRQTNLFPRVNSSDTSPQLYVSSMSGAFRIATIGDGAQTTSSQTITNLPGLPTAGNTSPYGFVLLDLSSSVPGADTLYIADDATTANGGGIQKYSFVGGTFVLNGTVTTVTTPRGLTASVSGTNVTLFVTNGTTLQTISDTSGFNAAINGTPTTLATAAASTAFRGVAFAPVTPPPSGQTAYAVSGTSLYRFNTATPGTTTLVGDTGINFAGIDFNPANGLLYGLSISVNAQLYIINTTTGAATPVGNGFLAIGSPTNDYDLSGQSIGFDFNPKTLQGDGSIRIRVTSQNGSDLRLNSATGGIAAVDPRLNPAPSPSVGSAYTNNVAQAATAGTTTLYNIIDTPDPASPDPAVADNLTIQNPANAGTQTSPLALSIDVQPATGFDIFTDSTGTGNTAFLATDTAVATGVEFYTVDLATGGTTLVGNFPSSVSVSDIAVQTSGNGVTPVTTGVVISEYRLSGPGNGSNGDLDEFIELFNQTTSALDLTGASVNGIVITRPIPAKGHLLLTNSGGYSLADYGGTDAAKGDLTYTGDITLGSTLTLRNASGTTVDEVTSVGLTPTTPTSQYSYARRLSLDTGLASSIPSDFNLVDVGATTFGPDSVNDTSNGKVRLGSPGPENLSSPLNRSVLYTNLSQDASQNTVRNASDTSVAPLGTLSLRRTVTNNTGTTLTKVRFRLINTTSGTPTVSSLADVRVVDGTASFVVGGVTVMPITVEKVAGATTGSLNSTFTLPLPAGGLTNGSSVSIDFKLGVFKAGSYRLAFLFEVLP